jgi:carbon starvation protein
MFENAAFIALTSFGILILAYFTYGRFVARWIFRLDPNRETPSHTLEDGVDYLPTRIPILFGHHFASIAGLGPILGPAIAVIWGWLPALLWVLFGSIFIGAVHDIGALFVSLRHQGHSVGDVCRNLMGPRAQLLALLIIFFLMSLAMGAFCGAISDLFVNFNPDAIIPSGGLMLVAIVFGISVYKLRLPLGVATVIALAAFGGLIVWGVEQPVCTYQWELDDATQSAIAAAKHAPTVDDGPALHSPYGAADVIAYFNETGQPEVAQQVKASIEPTRFKWVIALLAYGFVASVLPVWLLLQPRDYINSFQLYFALAAMLLGLTIAAMTGAVENHIEAPMIRTDVPGAPPIFPFLFVTIACGAVSGFHSLVSSGTTVKQLNRETDALPIGYGAMLTEGGLAVLVIMACAAGLGAKYWGDGGVYSAWQSIGGGGLAAQLSAVVRGGANFLAQLGIPREYGRTFLAVTITAFALTTLDSATRLLRFNVEEIFHSVGLEKLSNRYVASLIAVSGIAFFALVPAGKTLWTLFGATNQLLAGLTLLIVSVFLFRLGRSVVYTLVPMVFMLGVAAYAMKFKLEEFWSKGDWALAAVSIVVLVMSVWLVIEAIISFSRGRGTLSETEPPAAEPAAEEPVASGR